MKTSHCLFAMIGIALAPFAAKAVTLAGPFSDGAALLLPEHLQGQRRTAPRLPQEARLAALHAGEPVKAVVLRAGRLFRPGTLLRSRHSDRGRWRLVGRNPH